MEMLVRNCIHGSWQIFWAFQSRVGTVSEQKDWQLDFLGHTGIIFKTWSILYRDGGVAFGLFQVRH